MGRELSLEGGPGDSGGIRGGRMSACHMACPQVGVSLPRTEDTWWTRVLHAVHLPFGREMCGHWEVCEIEPFMDWGTGAQFLRIMGSFRERTEAG